jgi:hypothetical protein
MLIKRPKLNFTSNRAIWVISLHGFAFLLAIFLGLSIFLLLAVLVLYVLVWFGWALTRTIPRRRRFEEHLKRFGIPFNKEELDRDKVVLMAVPFESATAVIKLYWHEGEMVFGVRGTFRKLLNCDVDAVKEIEVLGNPVIHIKLKDGNWEDEFYLPVDTTFKNC